MKTNTLIGVIHTIGAADEWWDMDRVWRTPEKFEESKCVDPDIISDAITNNIDLYGIENPNREYLFFDAIEMPYKDFPTWSECEEFCEKIAEENPRIEATNIQWAGLGEKIYFFWIESPILFFPLDIEDFSEKFIGSLLCEDPDTLVELIRDSGQGDIRPLKEVDKIENVPHYTVAEILEETDRDVLDDGFVLAWEEYGNLEAYHGWNVKECVTRMAQQSPIRLTEGIIYTHDHDALARIIERM